MTPGKKNSSLTSIDMQTKNKQPDKKQLREFGLLTGAILACLFGLFFPWLFERGYPLWPWIVAGALWSWALLLPATLAPVYRLWMLLGQGLGWINSRIILGIMFYLIVLPTGLLMRMFRKDPMMRKFDRSGSTYRIIRSTPKKDHIERPF